jgi:peptidoglycan/LPS O-acetylase OafA/YrhL
MNLLKSLTSLRFFAAFLVVGFHFFSFDQSHTVLNRIFQRGNLGVDFFFILSGFVLGLNFLAKNTELNLKEFYFNRITKIAPLYYLALVLCIPILIFEYHKISSSQSLVNYILSLPLVPLFLQSFTGIEETQKIWNIPSWSVSVEFFFYLIFPFISVRILKAQKFYSLLLALFFINIVLYAIVSSIPKEISLLDFNFHQNLVSHPLFHLPQFLIGNLMSKIYFEKKINQHKFYFIFFIILTLFLFIGKNEFLNLKSGNPLLVFTFSGLIFTTALVDKNLKLLNTKIFVLLGESSYALYILQEPLKVFLQQIWSKVFNFGDQTSGFLYAIYLSITLILLSIAAHLMFEIPVRKFLLKKYGAIVRSRT